MPRILVPRTDADTHDVAEGETLQGIFEAKCTHDALTWEEFTGYNFGTSDHAAVNRALVELVGCRAVDAAHAGRSTLDPAQKPAGSAFQLRIPRLWKPTALKPMRTHTVRIRERLAPPGVSITALDPWFLPGKEACRIAYALDGSAKRADRASVAVYASRYSSATVDADGGVHYPSSADLADTVIWTRPVDATPRDAPHAVDDWKGESTSAAGVLKKRGVARYVNVASSPYTVVVRFHKDDADAGARVVLAPFWPRFDSGDKATTDSLVFRWSIEGCTRALVHGQLLVHDREHAVVFRKALDSEAIAAGELAWDAGRDVLEKAKMPYRVQLQVRTGEDEAMGVALAAMHTEVRLWVHPDVGKDPQKTLDDPQCMDVAVAPFVPAGDAPAKDSDRWCGLRLAALGFHPGPVDGDTGTDAFRMALREFQRSYPRKNRVNSSYVRQAVTGTLTPDAKAMLAHPMVEARTLFGEATGDEYAPSDLADDGASARLADKDHERGLIVWVDDQHCYTAGPVPAGCDPEIGLGDYRRGMDQAFDGKVARDQESICRPWIPLAVRPRVLSRADALDRDTMPAWDDAMAACVGPLRVDWMFREARPDTTIIAKMMEKIGVTDGKRVRTKAAVEHALKALWFEEEGRRYANCPKDRGGLRPNQQGQLGTYYSDLFGLDAQSLKPWKAVDDAATKRVCVPVHDDLGQASDRLFAGSVGRSGVYFRPSTIAGDSYRLRAQVSFAAAPGDGDHPNRAVLEARYPQPPVVQTCPLRVWRRTVFRGNVTWTRKTSHWDTALAATTRYYRACNVHIVQARGATHIWPASRFLDTTSQRYKTIVTGSCAKAPYTDASRIAPRDNYVWPWTNRKHYGIEEVPDASVTFADYREKFLDNVFNETWALFRGPILTAILDGVEKATARYRGHLLVSFDSTPAYWVQIYYCSEAAKHRNMLIETTSGGGSATGDRCHVTGCHGTLAPGYTNSYQCPVCHADYPDRVEATPDSHPVCETQCAGTKQPDLRSIPKGPRDVTYTCDVCNDRDVLPGQYHVAPYFCGRFCGGNANPTALVQTSSTRELKAGLNDGLPLAAVGSALGASFVFADNDPLIWAHEMGHHRHMEHAAGAPCEKTAQHDSAANPDLTAHPTAKAEEKRWDRSCVMGYVEKQFFCAKCVFKNRGWKVEGLPMPPSTKDGL